MFQTTAEIKTRTIPTEGEQYGHPYQDGVNNLRHRVNQRTASVEWVADMYLGELDVEAGSRRWQSGIRPSRGRTRNRPRSVRTRSKRLRNRGSGSRRIKYRTNPRTKRVTKVKRTPQQVRMRSLYDRDYNRRRRKKTPSFRKRQRGYYRRRRASDMNLEAIQSVMAEMGLYEIRPPDTDELYVPSGVPYSPSGGNG